MTALRDANDILREDGPDELRHQLDTGRRPHVVSAHETIGGQQASPAPQDNGPASEAMPGIEPWPVLSSTACRGIAGKITVVRQRCAASGPDVQCRSRSSETRVQHTKSGRAMTNPEHRRIDR
jgi:hypothetical protein